MLSLMTFIVEQIIIDNVNRDLKDEFSNNYLFYTSQV